MAYTKIVLENPKTGHIKEAPVGFSWTVFFWVVSSFVRGDRKWETMLLLLAILTWGISGLVFMFIYNKLYIKDLIGSGFKVKSVGLGTVDQVSQKIGLDLPTLESAKLA